MNKKILLIGSGPSSLSACIRLLEEENVEIYLIDGKDIDNLETEGCIYSKKIIILKVDTRNYLRIT